MRFRKSDATKQLRRAGRSTRHALETAAEETRRTTATGLARVGLDAAAAAVDPTPARRRPPKALLLVAVGAVAAAAAWVLKTVRSASAPDEAGGESAPDVTPGDQVAQAVAGTTAANDNGAAVSSKGSKGRAAS
jgi:ferric-dicitrate binding protein FerR (iron transport regulator)